MKTQRVQGQGRVERKPNSTPPSTSSSTIGSLAAVGEEINTCRRKILSSEAQHLLFSATETISSDLDRATELCSSAEAILKQINATNDAELKRVRSLIDHKQRQEIWKSRRDGYVADCNTIFNTIGEYPEQLERQYPSIKRLSMMFSSNKMYFICEEDSVILGRLKDLCSKQEDILLAEENAHRSAIRAAKNSQLRADAMHSIVLAKSAWDQDREREAVRFLERAKSALKQIRYADGDIPDQDLLSLRDTVSADLEEYEKHVNAKAKRCDINAAVAIRSILSQAYSYYRLEHHAQSPALYGLHEQLLIETLSEEFKSNWDKFDSCEIPVEFKAKLAQRIYGTTSTGIKPIGWKKTFTSMCMFSMPNVSIAYIDDCLRDIRLIFAEYKPAHSVERINLAILTRIPVATLIQAKKDTSDEEQFDFTEHAISARSLLGIV